MHYLGDLSEVGIPVPEEPLVAAVIPRSDIQGLDKNQKDAFEALLEEFKDIFANSTEDLGCAWDESHKVNVGDSKPISQRAYRRSPRENLVINEEVQKLLSARLLVPLRSPWASPLLLVKKRMVLIEW